MNVIVQNCDIVYEICKHLSLYDIINFHNAYNIGIHRYTTNLLYNKFADIMNISGLFELNVQPVFDKDYSKYQLKNMLINPFFDKCSLCSSPNDIPDPCRSCGILVCGNCSSILHQSYYADSDSIVHNFNYIRIHLCDNCYKYCVYCEYMEYHINCKNCHEYKCFVCDYNNFDKYVHNNAICDGCSK